MTEPLNELCNCVLVSLQSSKKLNDGIAALRALYFFLDKHKVPLPSTTYNFLLAALQDKDNARFKNPKILQLAVLVLYQANRPVKQLHGSYTRADALLKSGIPITRECLFHLVKDMDTRLFFVQPSLWGSILHYATRYSSLQLSPDETDTLNITMYNFIRCNPSLLKRSMFSRGTKYHGPNGVPLNTALTVLCTTTGKPTPLPYLHAISFSYLKRWITFAPPTEMLELELADNAAEVITLYDEEKSTLTRASRATYKTQSVRLPNQSLFNDRYFDLKSEASSAAMNMRALSLNFSNTSGNPAQNAILNHVSLVIEHCTKLPFSSREKITGLAAYLECIKILDSFYEICLPDVRHEILESISKILQNVRCFKERFILIPPALSVMMKHSPDFKFTPESNEMIRFLYSDVISISYQVVAVMYEVIMFSLRYQPRLGSVLRTYFPNILKIAAFHPRNFAKEISLLLSSFYDSNNFVELFLSVVNIPVLSAITLVNPKPSSVVEWLRRTKISSKGGESAVITMDVLSILPEIKQQLERSKVFASAQLSNALLEIYLKIVSDNRDGVQLFWICFTYVYKIIPIPEYKEKAISVILSFLKKVCDKHGEQVLFTYKDDIVTYLSKIEQYKDPNISAQLISLLVPLLCNAELSADDILIFYKTIEQELYIVSVLDDTEALLNALILLFVVVSVKEPTFTERTLQCLNNLLKKVYNKKKTRSLFYLIEVLSSILNHGGGSIVEIYKTYSSHSTSLPTSTLTILEFLNRTADIS